MKRTAGQTDVWIIGFRGSRGKEERKRIIDVAKAAGIVFSRIDTIR